MKENVENQEKKIGDSFKFLLQQYPEIGENTPFMRSIQDAIKSIKALMKEANELAISYQEGQSKMLHLAGLGLMVEIIAHEINRATEHALVTLSSKSVDTVQQFRTLEAQLKTLYKRIKVLDPLDTTARQRKERFDLVQWIQDILDYHKGQFERHNIKLTYLVQPRGKGELYIQLVKGMVVQVLENLISNSVYWLKQERKMDSSFSPSIDVAIDVRARKISFSDNGPGVEPERKEIIFQPFVSTKPPGEGKGLGLYIAQEIAKYHEANLYLSDETTAHSDRLNTFILSLGVNGQ